MVLYIYEMLTEKIKKIDRRVITLKNNFWGIQCGRIKVNCKCSSNLKCRCFTNSLYLYIYTYTDCKCTYNNTS